MEPLASVPVAYLIPSTNWTGFLWVRKDFKLDEDIIMDFMKEACDSMLSIQLTLKDSNTIIQTWINSKDAMKIAQKNKKYYEFGTIIIPFPKAVPKKTNIKVKLSKGT